MNLDRLFEALLTSDDPEELEAELESADITKVRTIIRQEVARIFFDLFRKRSVWGS